MMAITIPTKTFCDFNGLVGRVPKDCPFRRALIPDLGAVFPWLLASNRGGFNDQVIGTSMGSFQANPR
jgi:hypothetical protein